MQRLPEDKVPTAEMDATPATQVRAGVPTLTYVLAAVGVAALGTGAYLYFTGVNEADSIRATGCAPRCNEDEVGGARSKIIAGNVAGAIGVAAVAGAAVTYFMRGYVPRQPGLFAPAEGQLALEANPSLSGGTLGLRGTF
jgi:hypothetical protein